MDITIKLTFSQALALQDAVCTSMSSMRKDLDYWKKTGGHEELIRFKEEDLRDLENTKAILKEAIIRTP